MRPVLCYLGAVTIALGLALCVIDRAEGLPRCWSLWEGPADVLLGILIVWISRQVGRGGQLDVHLRP